MLWSTNEIWPTFHETEEKSLLDLLAEELILHEFY
jgi:hypothetical protein